MKRRTMFLALVLPVVMFAATWSLAGHGAMVIGMEGGFDLSELADGETRIFQAGEKSVTAYRDGDRVTIEKGDGTRLPACDLTTDRCTIRTDDENIYMSVSRERVCEGEDCVGMDVDVEGLHEGARIMIRKSVSCDGEDCAEAIVHGDRQHNVFIKEMIDCDGEDCGEWITSDGDHMVLGGNEANVFVLDREAMPSASVSWVSEGDGGVVMLDRAGLMWKGADDMDGCPDGYRQMRYTDETAEDGYLCVGENAGSQTQIIEHILHRKPKRN